MPQKIVGIILGGGSGHRFAADVPKQFCPLNGRMVIEHAPETFRASGLFSQLIVVLPPEWLNHPRAAAGDLNVMGGETRNASTWNALQRCEADTDLVLIHDAARPFVTRQILTDCVEALQTHAAVDVCIPADDTIVQVKDGMIERIPDRSRLMRGQTPQGFHFRPLLEAYRANLDRLDATDDVSIFLRNGGACKVVPGSTFNLKLTHPQDLFIAERILQYQPAQPCRPLALGGHSVLLLGATGGIGAAVRERLVLAGADVTAPTRQEWNLAETEVPRAFRRRWDVIIHSAGVLNAACDATSVDALFAVNFRSVVAVTDLARQEMDGGSIVIVGSSSAMKGRANIPLYAASKAAVNNFVEGIAPVLWRERGIRINCVNPGSVNTRMITGGAVVNADPLEPNDVADAIMAYVKPTETGQIVNIRKHVPAPAALPRVA